MDLGSEAKASICEELRSRITTAKHCGHQRLSLSHTPGEHTELDGILRGGIPTGMITEITGAKTMKRNSTSASTCLPAQMISADNIVSRSYESCSAVKNYHPSDDLVRFDCMQAVI